MYANDDFGLSDLMLEYFTSLFLYWFTLPVVYSRRFASKAVF